MDEIEIPEGAFLESVESPQPERHPKYHAVPIVAHVWASTSEEAKEILRRFEDRGARVLGVRDLGGSEDVPVYLEVRDGEGGDG